MKKQKQKTAFLFYYDYVETIMCGLAKEEIADLLLAAVVFDRDNKETVFTDRAVNIAYKRLTADLKRNHIEYDEKCEQNRQNAWMRWHPDIPYGSEEYYRIVNNATACECMQTDATACDRMQMDANYAYNDNGTVKESDTVKDTVIEKDKGIGVIGEREKGKHIYTPEEVAPVFIEKFYSLYPLKINRGELKDFVYGKRLTQEQCHNLYAELRTEISDGIAICQAPDVWLAKHLQKYLNEHPSMI